MKHAIALGALLASTWVAEAGASPYAFAEIGAGQPGRVSVIQTAISEAGEVAYAAVMSIDGVVATANGVFRGDGSLLTEVLAASETVTAEPSGVSIDTAGHVAFAARVDGMPGIYISSGGALPPPIVDSSGIFQDFVRVIRNQAGAIAFTATLSGGASAHYAIDGGAPVPLYSFPPNWIGGGLQLGETGFVSWTASSMPVPSLHLVYRSTTSGGEPVIIAQQGSEFCSLGFVSDVDETGQVAFHGSRSDCVPGVFVGDGSAPQVIVDADGPYASFSALDFADAGRVVFSASLDAVSGEGIFVGPNPATDAVIQTGDALLGSEVDQLFLGDANGAGQIVFRALLVDGRDVVVRATPVPESDAALASVAAGAGLAMLARRARAR